MERNKRTHLLFLLLALLHVCTITKADCPSLPDKGLTCYNDFNHVITCVWNSTFVSDHADTACTIYAERVDPFNRYSSSCNLEPIDVSRPAIQKCSMVFETKWRFLTVHELTISVNCNPVKQSLSISYKPSCHIKLNPPPRPEINFTTFSWIPQDTRQRISLFRTQLLWKQQGQSWSDPSVQQRIIDKQCEWDCRAEIGTDLLIPDERYEARVRVMATEGSGLRSTWSDWSPTTTWVSPIGEAKPRPPPSGLTCYNDFNHVITCVWSSTFVSDHADTACTIYAERVDPFNGYNSSCNLEPIDVSRPAIQKCSMVFETKWRFLTFHELTISVNCTPVKQSLSISYKPSCHIKLNPPPKPEINFTTFSWIPQDTRQRISLFRTQLLWKQQGQSWSDPSVQQRIIDKQCEWQGCRAEIGTDLLILNESYEARVRVKTTEDSGLGSTWSDWSPTTTWVSPIGEAKPTPTPTPPPSEVTRGVLGTLACVVLFALLLILVRTDKTTWIYIAKTIRGPPVPNPEKSSVNFQNWLSPYFTNESIHSFLRPVEIISVEVTSTVDAVAPSGPEAALQEKMRSESSYDTTSSNFSNPSYSQLSPPPPLPPVSSLTAGNLEACGTDTPYGPVGSHGEGKSAGQVEDEVRAKEEALLQLLSKRSNNSESMLVISDYEKADKSQIERLRLQSLDSGVCSGEEVSQESLEADSINVSDCQDDGPEANVEREEGNGQEVNFHKLFGGMLDQGSIQVCSGYEQVQKLQADSTELPSLDSGISSGSEEQLSQEESLEDVDKSTESTSLLFPSPSPPPSSALACSSPSFTPQPFNFCVAGLSAVLPPLPCQALERIPLMSTIRSVEPSGDGYMPVRQEQS